MAGRFEKPAAALGCGQQCVEPVGARLYAGPAAQPARIARLRAGRLAHAGAADARLRHRGNRLDAAAPAASSLACRSGRAAVSETMPQAGKTWMRARAA